MSTDYFKKIEKQNEVIISLLGRMAFTKEQIREIVTKNKKKDPEKYVDGYNACDGNKNVNEIAAIIGVDQSTLSPILLAWEEIGIIYEVEKPKGKFYRRLFQV
jgi:DNA-binding MarR family transcriptional regulator